MTVTKEEFGSSKEGEIVERYTLTNSNGLVAKVCTYGAILTELHVPDREGKLDDVVLGFKDLESYLKGHPHLGATTGRYANRIAKGEFELDGLKYPLAINNGPNHLHGGLKGIDKVIWEAKEIKSSVGPAVQLFYMSPDGEEGYPGNLGITVTYTLTEEDELHVDYVCDTDKATPVNLTNHSYWNLAGENSGSVLNHQLKVNADQYTPVDSDLIPTGECISVDGTVLDFRVPIALGNRFESIATDPVGYDNNYVLNQSTPGKLEFAAELTDPSSGRVMLVFTTEPAIQIYTGNFLDGTLQGKGGRAYQQHDAVCLEAQHYPDSPNQPSFPSTILRPGERYLQTTIHKFSVSSD
jgi:aldose 1-epimerase